MLLVFDKPSVDTDRDGVVDAADHQLSYDEYCGLHGLLWQAYHTDAEAELLADGVDLDGDGVADASAEQIEQWREEDWARDSGGDGSLSGIEFRASVFEMVDLHCDTDTLAEYLHCLETQFDRVFKGKPVAPLVATPTAAKAAREGLGPGHEMGV